jgi:hypothetical protein
VLILIPVVELGKSQRRLWLHGYIEDTWGWRHDEGRSIGHSDYEEKSTRKQWKETIRLNRCVVKREGFGTLSGKEDLPTRMSTTRGDAFM